MTVGCALSPLTSTSANHANSKVQILQLKQNLKLKKALNLNQVVSFRKHGFFLLFPLLVLAMVRVDAKTRVYEINHATGKYYAVVLEPQRESYFVLGETRLPDVRKPLEMGVGLLPDVHADGMHVHKSFAALEFLLYDGEPFYKSDDFIPPRPEIVAKLKKGRLDQHYSAAIEEYLVEVVEEWCIRQYVQRARIKDSKIIEEIRQETRAYEDGVGFIAILDEQKRIVSTLSMAIRTIKAPAMPAEARHKIDLGEHSSGQLWNASANNSVPVTEWTAESGTYEYFKNGERVPLKTPALPVLTAEIKRYITDMNVAVKMDMLPVLLYVAETAGMSWRGPATRFAPVHNGRAIDLDRSELPVIGRYVVESDAIAARMYRKEPYNFKSLGRAGEDYLSWLDRPGFLSMIESASRSARIFDINSGLKTGEIAIRSRFARVGANDKTYQYGDYQPKRLKDFLFDFVTLAKHGATPYCGRSFESAISI